MSLVSKGTLGPTCLRTRRSSCKVLLHRAGKQDSDNYPCLSCNNSDSFVCTEIFVCHSKDKDPHNNSGSLHMKQEMSTQSRRHLPTIPGVHQFAVISRKQQHVSPL